MKKLLIVLAIGTFAACNSSTSTSTEDTTTVAPSTDTSTMMAPDSTATMAPADTTHADSTK